MQARVNFCDQWPHKIQLTSKMVKTDSKKKNLESFTKVQPKSLINSAPIFFQMTYLKSFMLKRHYDSFENVVQSFVVKTHDKIRLKKWKILVLISNTPHLSKSIRFDSIKNKTLFTLQN